MVDLFIINFKQCENYNTSYLFLFLDKKETTRYNLINGELDKKKYAFSRYVVKTILSKYIDKKSSGIKFRYNRFGKPLITKNPIHFNLSHTDDYLIVGISEKPLGVDIEKIKNINLDVAKLFCTEDEIEYIKSNQGQHNFYKLWTLKESFVKAVGNGLYFDIKDLNFNLNNKKEIELATINYQTKSFKFFTTSIKDNIISVCYSKEYGEPSIININSVEGIIGNNFKVSTSAL